jgi:hypothetical protein
MAGAGTVTDTLFIPTLANETKFLTELVFACLLALPLYGGMAKPGLQLQKKLHDGLIIVLPFAVWRVALLCLLLYFTLITIAAQAYHPFLYFQF